ncbi:MAG: carbon storage regulator [Eubacteriales bacterium]|nr:carbon storage regulator [Eubacteriales bacterium]
MLRLTVSPEEYLMIGDNIKIIFLGGTKNHLRIMVDAPKEMSILRSDVIERDYPEKADHRHYYEEPEPPAKYLKPKQKP